MKTLLFRREGFSKRYCKRGSFGHFGDFFKNLKVSTLYRAYKELRRKSQNPLISVMSMWPKSL